MDGDAIVQALVAKDENGKVITEIRQSDGYVNATKMCRAAGKRWNHYISNETTTAYIESLKRSAGEPADLIRQTSTGPNEKRGTWVHRHVAIHLAMWCNPLFSVAVIRLFDRYAQGDITTAECEQAAINIQEVGFLTADRIVRFAPRAYNETFLYVRVCLPPEYVRPLDGCKVFTTDVVKFGIAYDIHNRNATYPDDNGFFLHTFSVHTRCEAEAIERIIRVEFQDVTVFGSREYLDAKGVASRLMPDETINWDEYQEYTKVATALFTRIVNITKAVWPMKYEDHNGWSYVPFEQLVQDPQTIIVYKGIQSRPIEVRVSFPRTSITLDQAKAIGIHVPSPSSVIQELTLQKRDLQRKLDAATAELATVCIPSTSSNVQQDASSTTNGNGKNGRCHGRIIARNVATGVEVVFPSCEKAARNTGMPSARVIRNTFLDKPRILKGCVFRSDRPGSLVWIPPKGLVYDPEVTEIVSASSYIEAVNVQTHETKVYESLQAATKYMKLPRKSISEALDTGRVCHGFTLRTLAFAELNNWASPDKVPASDVFVVNELNTRPRFGAIIVRNITSGEESSFANAHLAAAHFDIDVEFLLTSFVDKPHALCGHAIRYASSTRRWSPPETLRYNNPSKSGVFVVAMHPETRQVTDIFQNVKAAAAMFNVPSSTLGQSLGTDKIKGGRLWRRADESEYNAFVEL